MKIKNRKVFGDSEEKHRGGGFFPPEIGLTLLYRVNCGKKIYTVRKKLADFSLLINSHPKKMYLYSVGRLRENLTGTTTIFDLCLPLKGQMPKQTLRYLPVPHPTHISFLVMKFSTSLKPRSLFSIIF